MARKLGQDFLDAHVVAYRLAGIQEPSAEQATPKATDDQATEPGQETGVAR
jgi:hypothetical protein